ncbi:MAG: glycosyltransferase family 2 protein [Burkholderiaceae bacterium]
MSAGGALMVALSLAAALSCVPAAMLLLEVLAALVAMRRGGVGAARIGAGAGAEASDEAMAGGRVPEDGAGDGAPRAPVAILIPAHDEAGGIGATLASVLAQLRDGDRLLVVADNCSDDTAAVARRAGAEVVERRDPERRGKGYALDFGVRHLMATPPRAALRPHASAPDAPGPGTPQAVLIVDADCQVGPGAVDALARACLRSGRPAQACYLMRYPPAARTLGARIAEFAFVVKNRVRPLGLVTLGWPCPLLGSGMAFPLALIADAPLANGHLVEDMKLGVDLSARGQGPLYVPQALVTSTFPSSEQGQRTQRERWEHGHLQTIATHMPTLLLAGLRRGDRGAVALAFDLAIPPLALLVMSTLAVGLVAAIAWLLGGAVLPMGLAALALAMLGAAVLLAWRAVARELLPFSMLCRVPAYVLAKLPLYRGFIGARQTAWVRSRRDHEQDPP